MGKRAQIIVVDDDELVLELAAVVLEEAGHSVICAVDGEDALDHLDDVDVDLVVTDKAMPRMDGLELCRAIRRDPRLAALPVLMLTAATEPADVLSGLEAGASSYLEKPVDAERLVQRVRALLEPAAVLQMDSSPNVVSHLVASLEERAMDRERFREQSRVHSSWRRSLEDVDAALDALKVQVAILDERGNIVRANAAWLDHATEHGLLDAGWGLGGALGAALVEGAVHSEHRRLARALRDVVSRDLDARVLDAVRCSLGPWTFCRIEVRRFVAAAGLRLLVTREDASARVIALRGSRLRLTLKQLFLDDPPLFVGLGRTPRALASALGWEAAEIWRRHPTG